MKRVIKAARVTDYIGADMLHKWMLNPNFGEVSSYRQLGDMTVETVEEVYDVFQGTESATKRRYWKFIRGDEGWEAYEVDKYGDRLRNSKTFLLRWENESMKRMIKASTVDYSDPKYQKAAKELFVPSINKLKKLLSKADEYGYDEETTTAIRDAIDSLKAEYEKYK